MDTHEKAEAVEAVSKEAIALKAYEKLSRKALDVDVPRSLSVMNDVLHLIDEAKKSSATPEAIAEAEQKVVELRQDMISATLVPLKAVEIIMVQGFVTETALLGRAQGFDFDIQLFTMAKAERASTIYIALRKRGNPTERYFKTQEEVTLLDEATLRELASQYAQNFVLTPDERKNS